MPLTAKEKRRGPWNFDENFTRLVGLEGPFVFPLTGVPEMSHFVGATKRKMMGMYNYLSYRLDLHIFLVYTRTNDWWLNER